MNNDQTEKTISVLNEGGIVIFPTDTAFGIGCRIDKTESIKKVFKIRGRSEKKAVLVLVSSIEMVQEYIEEIPQEVIKKLIKNYWPGGLTIILKCKKDKVSRLVTGGRDTLGVRLPDHPTLQKIIDIVNVPIIAPSANFSGQKTPYTLDEVDKELIRLVDYVLPGECTLKKASTVIDCTTQPWEIVRSGAVEVNY